MFSVLTFNCDKGNCHVENIGLILKESNPDIICLQEFNQTVALSLVQYKLEENYVFITAPLSQGWSSTVIYSKLPVIKSKYFNLEGKSRKNILVRVLFNDRILDVVSVHLDPGRNNTKSRYQQYISLLKSVDYKENSTIPVILTGDFNMAVNEIKPWPPKDWNSVPLLNTFDSRNACITSPSKFAHPFDRCLYKNLLLIETKLIGINPIGSDHYGLLNIFQL